MSQGNKFVNRTSQEGFSLIELMIVIAIIGVLAAVAVPNFLNYVNKAKQVEAQSFLSTLYTAETSYYITNNTFGNLANISFPFSGNYNYDHGFTFGKDDTNGICATAANGCTDKSGITAFPKAPAAVAPTKSAFTALSVGTLKSTDVWSINEKKSLQNNTPGL